MKLSELRIGDIVINNSGDKIGHVVGLAENIHSEIIAVVRFPIKIEIGKLFNKKQETEELAFHPDNLMLLSEYEKNKDIENFMKELNNGSE